MKKIKFGFSSCPNDTFIFYALVNNRIDTRGFDFEFVVADVEELNKLALKEDLDVTKISYSAYGRVMHNYILSNYGSALGKNNGPLIISAKYESLEALKGKVIAVPGENTTANLLMSIAFPFLDNKKEYLFSDIEDAILNNEVDAGLIIHETRFTYSKKGLKKIVDLGEWWENNYNLPLPLGGICIKREFSDNEIRTIDEIIGESVRYAFNNRVEVMPFVKKYAQESDNEIIKKHIELYVNEYTAYIGKEGRRSVSFLLTQASNLGFFNKGDFSIFVEHN